MIGIDLSPQSRHRVSMTDQEEKERRFSIQAIMKDPTLSPHERRKSIQCLMDGRRRSSVIHMSSNVESKRVSIEGDMTIAAASVASSFAEDEDISRISKKRSSPKLDQETPPSPGNEQFSKRQTSLRESFTTGCGTMEVKNLDYGSACAPSVADPIALARRMEKSRPPCGHYQRNCSIVSPCCGLVFGCRICHNDSPDLPPPFSTSGGNLTHDDGSPDEPEPNSSANMPPHRYSSSSSLDESHHEIDRFGIKEVICRECFTRQSSKT